MKISKFVAILTGVLFCMPLFAQQSNDNSNSSTEKSVESEYMSSVEDVVISGLAASDERDSKLVALQYLEDAADSGDITPAMIETLNGLAGEGISTVSRNNGRLANNYPDIRARACKILGKAGTDDAAIKLTQVVKSDNEPMVLTEAIKALGEIGYNENDVATDTIVFISNRVETLNPTSSMALEVIIALEKLAPDAKNKRAIIDCAGRIASDYRFVTPVRTRALEFLKTLKGSNSSSSNNKSNKNNSSETK